MVSLIAGCDWPLQHVAGMQFSKSWLWMKWLAAGWCSAAVAKTPAAKSSVSLVWIQPKFVLLKPAGEETQVIKQVFVCLCKRGWSSVVWDVLQAFPHWCRLAENLFFQLFSVVSFSHSDLLCDAACTGLYPYFCRHPPWPEEVALVWLCRMACYCCSRSWLAHTRLYKNWWSNVSQFIQVISCTPIGGVKS